VLLLPQSVSRQSYHHLEYALWTSGPTLPPKNAMLQLMGPLFLHNNNNKKNQQNNTTLDLQNVPLQNFSVIFSIFPSAFQKIFQ